MLNPAGSSLQEQGDGLSRRCLEEQVDWLRWEMCKMFAGSHCHLLPRSGRCPVLETAEA